MHREVALSVFVDWRSHRTNDGEFVGHFPQLGKKVADFQSALAALFEFEGRCEHVAIVVELCAFNVHRHRFPIQFPEFRLRIERINV
jgi:hypothetical protein